MEVRKLNPKVHQAQMEANSVVAQALQTQSWPRLRRCETSSLCWNTKLSTPHTALQMPQRLTNAEELRVMTQAIEHFLRMQKAEGLRCALPVSCVTLAFLICHRALTHTSLETLQ